MGKRSVCFILVFWSLLGTLGAAQNRLTLEEATALALRHNPDILLAERELEVVRGRKLEVQAMPDPSLVFSREGLAVGSPRAEEEVTFGVEQLVEFPGKRALRAQTVGSEEAALTAELESLKLFIAAEVKKAYYRVVHTQMTMVRIEEILDILKQYQDMATFRFQAGQVSSLDVLRGRLEAVRVQGELIETRRRHRENLAALGLILGQSVEESLTLSSGLDFTPLEKNLPALRQEVETRPSLRAASFRLEQSLNSLRLARKSWLPDFTVGLYYPSLRTSGWGFSVGVSLPLWRDRRKGQVAQAEASWNAAVTALEARRQRILTLIAGAYADVRAAEERVVLFEKSLLGEVETMLELGISQYQFGQIDSLNLFDVYRLYKATRLEYLDALLAHKIALAELETAGER